MSIIIDAINAAGIVFKEFEPKDDQDGLAFILGDQPVILIAKGMPLARQRFTAAHELGHIVLGHVDNDADSRGKVARDIELEADLFAVVMVALAYALEQVEAKLEAYA